MRGNPLRCSAWRGVSRLQSTLPAGGRWVVERMSFLAPFVCIRCRSSFRRPFQKDVDYRPCVSCGQDAVRVDVRFRTPRKADDKQWKKVEFLFEHGFYFQKVYRQISRGTFLRVPYPRDLAEARRFVVEFKSQAIAPGSVDG